jgi:hypothetical protein
MGNGHVFFTWAVFGGDKYVREPDSLDFAVEHSWRDNITFEGYLWADLLTGKLFVYNTRSLTFCKFVVQKCQSGLKGQITETETVACG